MSRPNRTTSHADPEYARQTIGLPQAILCDLDGTLALLNKRNPYDASGCENDVLNRPVALVLQCFRKEGFRIVLISGRMDQYKEQTVRWLKRHGVLYDDLFMRRANDRRKDSIIKREIYDREIRDKYYVEFVLDDRNQVVDLWRKDLKLPCFQVYYGDF